MGDIEFALCILTLLNTLLRFVIILTSAELLPQNNTAKAARNAVDLSAKSSTGKTTSSTEESTFHLRVGFTPLPSFEVESSEKRKATRK
ncbi:MAG: hypothetical protein WC712_14055 [Candidatus Brocadiia bacterium]